MRSIWNKPLVLLISGQLGTAALLLGLPTALVLGVFVWPWASAALLALVLLQVGIHASQIAGRGTWIPQKWTAVAFLALPVAYLGVSFALFSTGHFLLGLTAAVMALLAIGAFVYSVKAWLSAGHTTDGAEVIRRGRHPADPPAEDESMTMVF